MKYFWQFALVAALTFPPLIHGQATGESVVRELTELKDQMLNAELERNTNFLRQVFADELVYVMTQGDVMNKTQLLTRVKSVYHKYDFLRSDNVQVRTYGNVAIMTDRTSTKGTNKGQPFGGEFRFVRIFVKKYGKWQVVMEQGTAIRQETTPSK